MSDYTPTTDEHRRLIEDAYGKFAAVAFDRWLAAYERKVRAEAWDEAVDAFVFGDTPAACINPYREDTE